MKVCYFGTYRANYSRNQIMLAGLKAVGVEVVECHIALWQSIEDRVEAASGRWASWRFIKRVLSTYIRLLRKYASLPKDYDIMVLGYPGQLDVFLARLLTWFHRKPLVLDLFMSIYLIALERRTNQRSQLSLWLLRWLEAFACRLPNRLICDTEAYVQWHGETHGLKPQKFVLVPTGADDRIFQPLAQVIPEDELFHVLYYGSYIPNHGVETMLEAARLLQAHPQIYFEFIGQGPSRLAAEQYAKQHHLTNVKFINWLDQTSLCRKMAQADIILGAFGITPQSIMTIQNKIYEGLAMRKTVLTGDAPTIRAELKPNETIYLVERANPQTLAQGILTLQADPALRHRLAQQGYQQFQQAYSVEQIGRRLQTHLAQVINRP